MDTTNTLTVREAAKLAGATEYFVQNAIKQGTMPGSYITGPNGVSNFHIPKDAFIDYLKYWRPVMTKDIALAIVEAITSANLDAKKAVATNND